MKIKFSRYQLIAVIYTKKNILEWEVIAHQEKNCIFFHQCTRVNWERDFCMVRQIFFVCF